MSEMICSNESNFSTTCNGNHRAEVGVREDITDIVFSCTRGSPTMAKPMPKGQTRDDSKESMQAIPKDMRVHRSDFIYA